MHTFSFRIREEFAFSHSNFHISLHVNQYFVWFKAPDPETFVCLSADVTPRSKSSDPKKMQNVMGDMVISQWFSFNVTRRQYGKVPLVLSAVPVCSRCGLLVMS